LIPLNSRLWKHSKTGICWPRKRIPVELRTLLGKTREKQSFGTRDPAEVKIKQPEALVAVEARWASLRAGPRSLRGRECHRFARGADDRWMALCLGRLTVKGL
jgi:hypothetical protein